LLRICSVIGSVPTTAADEFHEFKKYCNNLYVLCTKREDNWIYAGESETVDDQETVGYSDWLWGVLVLNDDGTIIPCSVFSTSSEL
jgi:hypothetical protein